MSLPNRIQDEIELDDLLSTPSERAIEVLAGLEGDILFLGVAGKMGPTMARMAKRASDAAGTPRRIIGASRFSYGDTEQRLQAWGIETLRCDLLDPEALNRLPDAPNVVHMAAMKFGTEGNQAATWAMNCFLPGLVCQRFRHSRIAAFSTGNVYPLVPVDSGGSREEDALAPVGEYAMTATGRERIFEYFSREVGIPVALIRLNYACELRYGVLVDLAQRIWNEEPVPLAMGYMNTLWQGDANAMSLCAFADTATPPGVLNLTGPETLRVREVAEALGVRMQRVVRFEGEEARDALLNNAERTLQRHGPPRVPIDRLLDWVADWTMRGGARLNKPTKFTVRDGAF